jgi:disulfide bond formation protein DsbB
MKISLSTLLYWFFHLWLLAMSIILLVALILQFAGGELPCPLCMLQRYCMYLSTLGPMWIILQAHRGELRLHNYNQGLALAQLGALLGAVIAGRQDLLHILPGDAGYGPPFFGLHLYSWAFLSFCGDLTSPVNVYNRPLCLHARGKRCNDCFPRRLCVGSAR